jgi:oxygen-independent coproporphyrinogen-3 oxidase
VAGLYIHIPFCKKRCLYCDFFSTTLLERREAYVEALLREIQARREEAGEVIGTIYIGGGTPSALKDAQLQKLLALLAPWGKKAAEYTVEVNPETMRPMLAGILADAGVNRISAGLQSEDPRLLRLMNRKAGRDETARMAETLRSFGITNLSLDLMYSLPGQTMEDLMRSVDFAASLSPDHISIYSLTIEENSVFGKKGIRALDEDTEADMYEGLIKRLSELGYSQYEISNFARPGKESKHNVSVWNYHDFIGIGYGAHGKQTPCRYTHAGTLKAYLADPLLKETQVLSKKEQMFESVMMGMRLKAGLDRKLFEKRYGRDVCRVYPRTVKAQQKLGMIEVTETHLLCSERGYPLLNSVLEAFLEEADL